MRNLTWGRIGVACIIYIVVISTVGVLFFQRAVSAAVAAREPFNSGPFFLVWIAVALGPPIALAIYSSRGSRGRSSSQADAG